MARCQLAPARTSKMSARMPVLRFQPEKSGSVARMSAESMSDSVTMT